VPFDIDKLARMLLSDKSANPSNYAMVTISEGARLGRRRHHAQGRGRRLRAPQAGRDRRAHGRQIIKERTGQDIIYQQVGYLMRSGQPRLARPHGAIELRGDGGRPGDGGGQRRMVALRGGTYTAVPISVTSTRRA
jgi:ATP-dependent phosphofructokinase / diphosphate-dependent phosphofructokinase